jgi:hypothetical protein
MPALLFALSLTHLAPTAHVADEAESQAVDRNQSQSVVTINRNGIPTTDDDLDRLLADHRDVEDLQLSGTSITDVGLARLQGLNRLHWLNISLTSITDAGLAQLRRLPSLQSIDLWRTGISDNGLRHLKGLPSLQDLFLGEGPGGPGLLSDAGIANLAEIRTLRSLHLAGAPYTEAALVHLKRIRGLRRLSLELSKLGDAGL